MADLRTNPIYTESQMSFRGFKPEVRILADGTEEKLNTGISYSENGDVNIRLYLPGANEVHFTTGLDNIWKDIKLSKDDEGYFTGVLKFDPLYTGPQSVELIVDGNILIYPYMPVSWHRHKPINYIDIPIPGDRDVFEYLHLKDVPHGACSVQKYYSKALGGFARCLVYTPPGYMKNAQEYPVLYLQHGLSENEFVWEYNGHVSSMMDNAIAEGKCKPFIIVMNNGMIPYGADRGDTALMEKLIVEDCIPFIDANYRTKTDKWNRAMAGLSMGSIQTSVITMRHPELFGYIGLFSGFLHDILEGSFVNDHLDCFDDPAAFEENYRVFYRSIGDHDFHVGRFEEDDILVKRKGIDQLKGYHSEVFPNLYHSFAAWRLALYHYIQMIF